MKLLDFNDLDKMLAAGAIAIRMGRDQWAMYRTKIRALGGDPSLPYGNVPIKRTEDESLLEGVYT